MIKNQVYPNWVDAVKKVKESYVFFEHEVRIIVEDRQLVYNIK